MHLINLFKRYATVGVLNTAVHWLVFLLTFYVIGFEQSVSNFIAFCVAVSFSFVVNARFTFKRKATGVMYVAYIVFMGCLSLLVGAISDFFQFIPLMTLIVFSVVSLVVGFLFSKFIIFRDAK
ncbi:GtrA family protein [Pseudomonas lurida]|uniref:GtrA family protein n=1 Tax=Pseudomonas lurida TaxID=244566 RepID=UPI002736426E|nr:GtrA family protein [Pseudomonas lurida]WLG26000.1 GtrA family protein [Pseudomonas lurida]